MVETMWSFVSAIALLMLGAVEGLTYSQLLKNGREISAMREKLDLHCKQSEATCPLHPAIQKQLDDTEKSNHEHREDNSKHFTGNKVTS